jgi:hypothetical protein
MLPLLISSNDEFGIVIAGRPQARESREMAARGYAGPAIAGLVGAVLDVPVLRRPSRDARKSRAAFAGALSATHPERRPNGRARPRCGAEA